MISGFLPKGADPVKNGSHLQDFSQWIPLIIRKLVDPQALSLQVISGLVRHLILRTLCFRNRHCQAVWSCQSGYKMLSLNLHLHRLYHSSLLL